MNSNCKNNINWIQNNISMTNLFSNIELNLNFINKLHKKNK